MAFQNRAYVSLENPDTRQFANDDPKAFLNQYSENAIIDEIQYVPKLFSYLQTAVDEKRIAGQYILTGSHNYLISEQLSQSLAGRVAILTLLPLSSEELVATDIKPSTLEEQIFMGGYPRIYQENIPPTDWQPNYIRTYIERDVRMLKNISDLSTFQKFLKLCAGRIGQLLNLSALATDAGITHNTAKAWISILESSFILFLLKPHHQNFNKRLVKMPKLYFYDTGLACSLLEIQNTQQLKNHYLFGGLFESFMLSEIMKYRLHRGLSPNCFFWRDRLGHEVDCLLEYGTRMYPLEMKSGTTVTEEFFKGIAYWKNLAGDISGNATILYGGDEEQMRKIAQVRSWKNIASVLKEIEEHT